MGVGITPRPTCARFSTAGARPIPLLLHRAEATRMAPKAQGVCCHSCGPLRQGWVNQVPYSCWQEDRGTTHGNVSAALCALRWPGIRLAALHCTTALPNASASLPRSTRASKAAAGVPAVVAARVSRSSVRHGGVHSRPEGLLFCRPAQCEVCAASVPPPARLKIRHGCSSSRG